MVVESALTMDFKANDKTDGEIGFLPSPGYYLIRLELKGTGKEPMPFAAVDLMAEGKGKPTMAKARGTDAKLARLHALRNEPATTETDQELRHISATPPISSWPKRLRAWSSSRIECGELRVGCGVQPAVRPRFEKKFLDA